MNYDAATAVYGALDTLEDATSPDRVFRYVTFEELTTLNRLQLTRNIFVGSSEFMQDVFRLLGVAPTLPKTSNQPLVPISLGEAVRRIREDGEQYFIKPVQNKLFSGMVFDRMCLSMIEKYPEDTPVYVHYPFSGKILSEWRGYVFNHKLVDCRNYSGDFMMTPDFGVYDTWIRINKEDGFPCAYTMDMAVMEDGMTVNVEYNDFWAIGNYGIENAIYYRMIRERYQEIVRTL